MMPGFYRDTPTWVSQARGQDLVTLLVGMPLLVVGLIGARRGDLRCLLLWLGAVGYMAYALGHDRPGPSAVIAFVGIFYNYQRLHSSLGYLTPVEFEQQLHQAPRREAA